MTLLSKLNDLDEFMNELSCYFVIQDGLTPLHCAARSGHDQVVDTLLEKGAPVESKTKNGLTPLHMAAQGDHVDCAKILLYHKAPIDEVTVVRKAENPPFVFED